MDKNGTELSKRWSVAALGMAGLVVGMGGLGCLGNPDDADQAVETTAATLAVDKGALDNALLNERELTTQGYTLEGRVWFQPDVHMSVFTDQNGGRLGLMTMRAGTTETLVDRSPSPEEAFDAYLQRVAAGKTQRPLTGLRSAGRNVALFDAAVMREEGAFTTRQSAATGFEACSSSWFNARCGEWAGVIGGGSIGSITGSWYLTDLRTANTQAQNDVTGEMAVACADKGNVTLKVTNTGAAFGPTTGSLEVTLNQGYAQVAYNIAGWKEEEYCKTKVLGICVDYAFRIKFAHFDSSIRATPSTNAEAMFCGNFSKRVDFYVGDFSCTTLACPMQCVPGDSRCRR